MSAQAPLGAALLLTVAAAIAASAGSAKAQITAAPGGQMIRPQSSVASADDLASRVHTNVELFVPASTASESASPAERTTPQSGPPYCSKRRPRWPARIASCRSLRVVTQTW